jgi:hypothetical protein
MFLHLREKTKFIRYNRCNRYIPTAGCKIAASPSPRRSNEPASFSHFIHFRYSSFLFQPTRNDSTNFTDCFNFSQRKGRRRSIPLLSGVASKKVDRIRLARRRRGSSRPPNVRLR